MRERQALVLDGEWEAALAVVRSLGRRGIEVDVASSRPGALSTRSRYCRRALTYPDPLEDASAFRTWVQETLALRPYRLVIPVTDLTICPLLELGEGVREASRIAIGRTETVESALSKSRTAELAAALGIPLPDMEIVRESAELPGALDRLPYPVVIKPERSKVWDATGRGRGLSISYGTSPANASEKILALLDAGPVTVQEFVPGQGVGIGVLASEGEVLIAFQHERLHEVPISGGASSYRVSAALDPTLLRHSTTLVRHLGWDGVAMIEFKRGESGPHLMEVNGRFWGSLPLAVAAGADFPFYLFEYAVSGRRDFPRDYRTGVRCRLLRRDLVWIREAISGEPDPRLPITWPSRRRAMLDTLRLLDPREREDTFRLSDPGPGMQEFVRLWKRMVRSIAERIRGSREPLKSRAAQPEK